MKKRLLSVLMVSGLCFICLLGGAYAASNNVTIQALLNKDVKITYNGNEQMLKDASGNRVYPISYNGTTYLPVRAVSELVKLPVNWDAANNTIALGTSEKQPVNLVDREHEKPRMSTYSYIISDPEMLKFPGSDATQEYKNGIAYDLKTYTSIPNYATMFDTKGFSELSFTAGVVGLDVTIQVYNEKEEIISTWDLKAGSLASKTIKLNGAQKIGFVGRIKGVPEIKDNDRLFIFEPVLK